MVLTSQFRHKIEKERGKFYFRKQKNNFFQTPIQIPRTKNFGPKIIFLS